MTRRGYVDIDLYGRGFDGIFGRGAEEENRRHAMMRLQAMKRFQERVKPGDYVDLDLYGRGDPRIFGPNAHIETQNEAQRHLEEAQQREKTTKFNLRSILFPSGIKAIAKKARALIRRISSSRTDGPESDIEVTPDDETRGNEENLTNNNAVPDSIAENQDEGEAVVPEAVVPEESCPVDATRHDEEVMMHVLTEEENDPSEEKRPKEDIHTYPTSKSDEKPEPVEEIITAPKPVEDTTTAPEVIDRDPRRVKSQLPSEEARPRIEKGYVARVVKSFSSFDRNDRNDEHMNVTGNAAIAEPSRLANYSSYPLRGISSPEGSESGSNKEASAGPAPNTGVNDSVSMTEEVAKRVLDTSDEELQLSFSQQLQNTNAHQSTDNVSTSSDEDLIVKNSQPNRTLLDDADRSVAIGKFTRLFRSDDSDSDAEDTLGTHDSRAPGGTNKPPETCLSTDDEQYSENIVPLTGISLDDVQLGEEDSLATVQQDDDEECESFMDSEGTSIINIVETPDLMSKELDEELLLQELYEDELEAEPTVASINIMETSEDPAIIETNERIAEQVVDKDTSSTKTGSNTTGSEAAENEQSSESIEDSDRSGDANSSSEVMSSSPEEESDDAEVAEVDSSELEEDLESEENIVEVQDVEEAEPNDGRVVDSSDAGVSSGDDTVEAGVSDENGEQENDTVNDVDGADQDQGDNKTFWQRLGLFSIVMGNSWIVF